MSSWIDFKELRKQLDFEKVLQHYGVEVKAKGDQHHGFCPLPSHQGERRSPSFSANLAKGIFQCFGCGAKGNIIDFAALMEKLDPKEGRDYRKAALLLKQQFAPDAKVTRTRNPKAGFKRDPEPRAKASPPPVEKPALINQPLDFELKDLDREHPYLVGRGFTEDTIEQFGLGFCQRGLLKGRVAIPLHDAAGRLVGYAGRVVDEGAISEENPRYKFPSRRERHGVIHEFHKSKFLYNGFRVAAPTDDLIVVEGFPSVWWLWQCGFRKVVALMGWSCSEEQGRLITALVKPHGRVWILPDGDEAGGRCALSVFQLTAPQRFVRWVKLADNRQPTDCPKEELSTLLPK